MKRATDLQMTTVSEVVRLISIDSVGAAVQELTGLSDPLEVAFVVASVLDEFKPIYARQFLAELRDVVNDRD